jgi:glycosyltransferase involved in cell wall biosynthesis
MSNPWAMIESSTPIKSEEKPEVKIKPKKKKALVKPKKKEVPISKQEQEVNDPFYGNIRVLFVLQPSSIKGGKKFILDGDSNWNMYLRGIIPELIEKKRWHFYVTVPHPEHVSGEFKGTKSDDETFYYQLCHPKIRDNPKLQKYITFIIMPYERNAFRSRYFFDTYAWKVFFKRYTDIDVVWCNYPELLRNLKTAMMSLGLEGPITITSYYWIDNKFNRKINEDVSYSFRQIDGAITADIPNFASQANADSFLEGMKEYYNDHAIKTVKEKTVIWDFGASETEILNVFDKKSITRNNRMSHPDIPDDKFVILFPNRLRSYTNWKAFINGVNELAKHRDDFVAIMTAPDQNKKQEALKKLCPSLVIVKNETREDYLRILHRADFVCSFFRKELYGGCATREAIIAGCIPIMYPEIAWVNMFPKHYAGFVQPNMKNFVEKIRRLIDDKDIRLEAQKLAKDTIRTFSYEHVVDKVIKNIEGKITFTDNDLKWAGYVYDAIEAIKDCCNGTKNIYDDLDEKVSEDLVKAVELFVYPAPKWMLEHVLFARSKSQLMQFESKGETKYNHWPFGNKNGFCRIRWALFNKMNIKDNTSTSIPMYSIKIN